MIKKLPKWIVITLAILVVVMIAWNIAQHFAVRQRVSDQRQRIQQQQVRILQVINEERTDWEPWLDESAEN